MNTSKNENISGQPWANGVSFSLVGAERKNKTKQKRRRAKGRLPTQDRRRGVGWFALSRHVFQLSTAVSFSFPCNNNDDETTTTRLCLVQGSAAQWRILYCKSSNLSSTLNSHSV